MHFAKKSLNNRHARAQRASSSLALRNVSVPAAWKIVHVCYAIFWLFVCLMMSACPRSHVHTVCVFVFISLSVWIFVCLSIDSSFRSSIHPSLRQTMTGIFIQTILNLLAQLFHSVYHFKSKVTIHDIICNVSASSLSFHELFALWDCLF